MPRLTPLDICAKMEAIRALAAEHGLAALEGLADYGAHHAMMPGHVARDPRLPGAYGRRDGQQRRAHDRKTILAALAVRLH